MECNKCGIKCENNVSLKIHTLTKHTELKIRCTLCNGNFKSIIHHFHNSHKKEYELYQTSKEFKYYELNNNFKCDFCDVYCINIIRHLENSHLITHKYCEICNQKVKSSALYLHMKNVHNENIYKYECDICNQVFKHKRMYKNHLKTDGHKQIEYTINNKEIIENRIETILNDLKPKKDLSIQCDKCKTYLSDEKSLERHNRHFHSKKFKCINCNIKFDEDELNIHLKYCLNIDDEESKIISSNLIKLYYDDLKCSFCNKQFIDKYSVKRHIESVHEKRKHICDICSASLTRSDKLKRHLKEVHNAIFIKCPNCKQDVRERNFKERHIQNCVSKRKISSVGKSKWEKQTSKYLDDNNISYIYEKTFPDLISHITNKNLRFDFYLTNYNILLEIHGKQHYQAYEHFGGEEKYLKTIENDKVKKEYALSNNFTYICLDTRDFDKEFENLKQLLIN